jgi:putative ABC transport system substrate-binding protein
MILSGFAMTGMAFLPGCGQQNGQSRRVRLPIVGVLSGIFADAEGPELAFQQALQELGYQPGQSLALEYRYANGREEQLPTFAAELAARPVDVFVALSGTAAIAAQATATAVPIVFISADPVGQRLVTTLAQPGATSRA